MTNPMQPQDIQTPSKELEQMKNQIKGMTAELNATKQLLNEQIASNLTTRTNLNLYSDAHAQIHKSNGELTQHIQNLLVKIESLEATNLQLNNDLLTIKDKCVPEPSSDTELNETACDAA